MAKKVRVRFAPSPTGPLHIGGVRTALFNYLFAKKYDGDFILRIEDTDQTRFVEGAEDYIKEALDWCGMPYDEGPGKEGNYGPYKQSERKALYKEYAAALINEGKAYYAFDTPESLSELRSKYEGEGKTFIYNWHNRLTLNNSLNLSETEIQEKLKNNEPYVIRFKSPENETLILNDEIRGEIKINTNTLDDKVLFKSDGMPTYHLANIVDDHLMEITHVIRGEEWLPSLALHELLYNAFGWESPKFAHLPLILKPNGKGKLSKRDGDKGGFPVFPLVWKTQDGISRGFREDGYLPEAVVNFLAFLGWNPGTEQELFTLEELISAFDLTRVNKAGAKFDPEKAKWYNQQYLVALDNKTIAEAFIKDLNKRELSPTIGYVENVVGLIKERAVFITDLWDLSNFFFEAPETYDDKAYKKAIKEDTPILLQELVQVIEGINGAFEKENVQKTIKDWITNKEIGFGKVMQPLRLSLVGAMQGPDVFDIICIIGKEETIKRITNIIK